MGAPLPPAHCRRTWCLSSGPCYRRWSSTPHPLVREAPVLPHYAHARVIHVELNRLCCGLLQRHGHELAWPAISQQASFCPVRLRFRSCTPVPLGTRTRALTLGH